MSLSFTPLTNEVCFFLSLEIIMHVRNVLPVLKLLISSNLAHIIIQSTTYHSNLRGPVVRAIALRSYDPQVVG
jgi:hypothetical protein